MYVALTWPHKKEEKIDTGYQQVPKSVNKYEDM
jgi:hypothetical protein